jgi:bifunctional polynucleotide phosphatase/kinase
MNPEKRAMLPKMAFSGFTARFRQPKVEEGFEDITKVDFQVRIGFSLPLNPLPVLSAVC